MAKGRHKDSVKLLGVVRRKRAALLVSTALQASVLIVLAVPGFPSLAMAQPAPNARPTGGTVIAGSASISRAPTQTTINQSSNRAALSWQTYNVGSQQSVVYHQPSSSSVTLNRVEDPNPSQIAGHIEANGSIVLMNQAGVTFYKGAQVNANGLMVTAASMSDRAMKGFVSTGAMQFDRAPDPNARVVNRGNITVKQAGLAALVAPSVANSGTIIARLGHVVLAGAQHTTVDMYGDGLVSIDVSGEVKKVPLGPDGKPVTALVTNSGVIEAAGGTVQLTAREADGIVTHLVDAGGKISANSVNGHTGVVALNGIGGDIVVQGQLSAAGRVAGTRGGAVEVNTTGNVTVAPTARIDVSGRAGGGTVALGTTLARAKGGPGVTPTLTAANVHIAKGAVVRADAMDNGNGGRVTVLSKNVTRMNGLLTAKGGPQGGDGGFVETSGDYLGMTTGSVDVSAPMGAVGTWLLDPTNLYIVSGTSGSGDQDTNFTSGSGTILAGGPDTTNDQLSTGVLDNASGNVLLQAANTIDVASSFTIGSGGLTMQAGQLLQIDLGATASATGNILAQTTAAGTGVVVNGLLTSTGGSVSLQSAANSAITLGNHGTIDAPGTGQAIVLQTDSLALSTGSLLASSGTVEIAPTTSNTAISLGHTNSAGTLGLDGNLSGISASLLRLGAATFNNVMTTTAGDITFDTNVNLGGIAPTLDLHATGSAVQPADTLALNVATLTGTVAGGVTLQGSANTISSVGPFTISGGGLAVTSTGSLATFGSISAQNIALNAGTIGIGGSLDAGTVLALGATSGGITESGGINAGILTGNGTTIAGGATLAGSNTIGTLGTLAVSGGDFSLNNAKDQSLTVSGPLTASRNVTLTTSGTGTMTVDGSVSATAVALTAGAGFTQGITSVITGTSVAVTGSSLTLAGTITDGGSTPGSGTVTLTANGPGTTGTIASTGAIIAGNLTGSANGAVLMSGTNAVTNLGSFAADSFSLANAINQALTVSGALTATHAIDLTTSGTADLTATGSIGAGTALNIAAGSGGIALDGTAALSGSTVDFSTTGSVSEASTAELSAGTLTSSKNVSSDVSLLSNSNTIGTLGSFTVTAGNFDLNAPGTLDISNPVSATAGTIFLQSGTIGFNTKTLGQLTANGGLISLLTNKVDNLGTSGATGSIDAGSSGVFELAPSTAATVTLGGTGGLSLTDTTGITAGTIRIGAITQPGSASLTTLASAITLAGAFNANGANLELDSAGAISQSAPLTNVSTLTLNGGSIDLSSSGNGIGELGDVSATSLALRDSGLLSVVGTVNASGIQLTADTLHVPGLLHAGGGTIALFGTTGGISESGTLIAKTLTGSAGTNVADFSGANATANQLGTLSGFVANGFTLNDGIALTHTGSLGAGSTLVLNDVGLLSLGGTATATNAALNAGTIAIGGSLNVTTLLALGASAGGVTAAGGITAGMLTSSGIGTGTIVGGATLTGTNSIGALATLAVSGGDFSLTDSGSLSVAGLVSAPNIALDSGTVSIPGTLNATTLLALGASSGGITESGGIIARTLTSDGIGTGKIFGGATLTGTNTIDTLGAVAISGGNFSLNDSGSLSVPDTVTARNIALDAGTIAIGGTLNAANLLALGASAGGITESGGIVADTLTSNGIGTGTIVGGATLTGINTIGTLGTVAASGGDFNLKDSGSLSVEGLVGAPNITLNAGTIGITGILNAAGRLTLGASAGGITSSGSIVAETLTSKGTIVGGATLAGSNTIGALGNFAVSGGAFNLTDTGNLSVAGLVQGPTISLNDGTIGIPGTVDASTLLALGASAGGISEPGTGVISTPSLISIGSISGGATLNGTANAIGAFGDFQFGGTLALENPDSPLAIGGTLTAGTNDVADITAPNVTIGGTAVLSVGTLTIATSDGGVNEAAGGSIVTNALSITTSGSGDVSLLDPNNKILASTGITVANGNLVLFDDPTLTLTGTQSANNLFFIVTQPGDGIALGTSTQSAALTAASSGQIELVADNLTENAASTISAHNGTVEIAPFSTTVTEHLAGTSQLALDPTLLGNLGTGTLVVGGYTGLDHNTTITASGLSVDGLADLTGKAAILVLDTRGAIAEPGTLIVRTLTGTAGVAGTGSVNLNQINNNIGTLAAFGVANGDFNLVNRSSGDLTVAGSISGNNVTITSGTLDANSKVNAMTGAVSLIASAGTLGQTGLVTAVTGGTLTAATDLTNTGSVVISAGPATLTARSGTLTQNGLVRGSSVGETAGAALNHGGSSDATAGTAILQANGGTLNQTGTITAVTGGSLTAQTDLNNSGVVSISNGPAELVASTGTLGQTGTVGATSGGTLTAATALTNTGSVVISAGPATLTASSGTLTQNGLVRGSSVGETAGTALNHGGSSDATAGAAILQANGGTLAQTGTITAVTGGSLTAQTDLNNSGVVSISNGPAVLVASTGTLGQTGTVTATSGGTLTAATDLTNAGSVVISAGPATLTANSGYLTQNGLVRGSSVGETAGTTLNHGGSTDATASTAVLQARNGTLTQSGTVTAISGGSLTASTDLTNSGLVSVTGANGMAALVATAGTLIQSGTVQTTDPTGGITESAGTDLTQSGLTNAGSLGASLTAIAGSFTQTAGIITAANGAVSVTAGDSVAQNAGTIQTTGTSGPVLLTANGTLLGNGITQAAAGVIHAADTGGSVTMSSSGTIGVAGTISATDTAVGAIVASALGTTLDNSGTLNAGTLASLTAQTDLTNTGSVLVSAGSAQLTASTGNLVQGGLVRGADVSETAGNALTHSGASDATASTAFLFANGGTLDQSGTVTAILDALLTGQTGLTNSGLISVTGSAGAASLTANTGNLTQSGTVQASGGAGMVFETATLGDLTHSGLTAAGSGSAALSAEGSFTQTGGLITAANGVVSVTAGSSLTQSGGTIQTTGSSPTAIVLTANGTGANGIIQDAAGVIHASNTGGSVTLDSQGSITLAGSIGASDGTAGTIAASAQGGALTNSGTLTAGAAANLQAQTDLTNSGTISVSNGPAMLTATTGTLGQSGTVSANSGGTLSAQSTLTNTGLVSAVGANGSLALISQGSDVDTSGTILATGTAGTIGLNAYGSINQTAGLIAAGNPGDTTTAGTPQVALVAQTGTIAQSTPGTIQANNTAGTISLGAVASGISTAGDIAAGGAAALVKLIAYNAIQQTSGTILSGGAGAISTSSGSVTPSLSLIAQHGSIEQDAGALIQTTNSIGVIGLQAEGNIAFAGSIQAPGEYAGSPVLTPAPTDGVSLISGTGSIIENSSHGFLQTGALVGSAAGSALLMGTPVNNVGTLGLFTVGGSFILTDAQPLAVVAPVTANTGSVVLNGLASAPQFGLMNLSVIRGQTGVTLTSSGSLTNDGTVTAVTNDVSLSSSGNATLANGGLIDAANNAMLTGGVVTNGGTILTHIGNVTLTANNGSVDNSGLIDGANDALVSASSNIDNYGTIGANQFVTLTGVNAITDGGLITAAGAGTTGAPSVQLTATNGIFVTDTGRISATNASGVVSLHAADIDTAGSIGATGAAGMVNLIAGDSINQTGGMIQSNGSGSIAASGAVGAPNLLLAANGGTIAQSAGAVLYAPNAAGVIQLRADGDILLNGSVLATGSNGGIALASTNGSILQSAATGIVRANTLIGSAGKSVTLDGTSATGNLIANLGSFSAGLTGADDFTLIDGQDLTIVAPVIANTGSVLIRATHFGGNPPSNLINQSTIQGQAGVTLTADSNVTNNGTVKALNDNVVLVANGGTLSTTGVLDAAQLIELQSLNGGMWLGGILSAPTIHVDSGANLLTLNSGISIMTGGAIRPYGTLLVLPPNAVTTEGAYFNAGSFQQLGSGTVNTLDGAGNVLSIAVSQGPLTFSSSGLTAPGTWMILNGANGFISGAIDVKSLDVRFTGASGGADLTGTINSYSGQPAAGAGNIGPERNANYHFNSCPIQSVSCVLLPSESIPSANPLNEIFIGSAFNPQNEGDLLLPIVTDQDY